MKVRYRVRLDDPVEARERRFVRDVGEWLFPCLPTAGDVVITDVERFTGWWKEMGATHVVVIANSPEEGAAACAQGATMWILRPCDTNHLVAAVKAILDA